MITLRPRVQTLPRRRKIREEPARGTAGSVGDTLRTGGCCSIRGQVVDLARGPADGLVRSRARAGRRTLPFELGPREEAPGRRTPVCVVTAPLSVRWKRFCDAGKGLEPTAHNARRPTSESAHHAIIDRHAALATARKVHATASSTANGRPVTSSTRCFGESDRTGNAAGNALLTRERTVVPFGSLPASV